MLHCDSRRSAKRIIQPRHNVQRSTLSYTIQSVDELPIAEKFTGPQGIFESEHRPEFFYSLELLYFGLKNASDYRLTAIFAGSL